jgi:hypothetical protein
MKKMLVLLGLFMIVVMTMAVSAYTTQTKINITASSDNLCYNDVPFRPTYDSTLQQLCVVTKGSGGGSVPDGRNLRVYDVDTSTLIYNSSDDGFESDNWSNSVEYCVNLSSPVNIYLDSNYSISGVNGEDNAFAGSYHHTSGDGWDYGIAYPSWNNYCAVRADFLQVLSYPTAPEGMFAYDLGQDAGMGESLVLMWNDSITNQSTLTYDCRIDMDWGFTCGYFEPPANITYELEYTNDSGANWFYMPPDNYSGCDICPSASGGAWLHGSTFVDSLNFSEGNLTFRVRALDGIDHSGWTESNEVRNCYAVWNCTESNTSDCLINDYYTCLNTTDISGCGWGYADGENALYLEPVITNKESCDYCTPDWNCTGYSANCTGGHLACDEVTDLNDCYASTNLSSDLYAGNYSEFTPQNCTAPPITGYVAQYGAGDLSKLIVDNLGEIILTLISMVGIVVLVVVIGWGAKKLKGFKGGK